MNILVLNGPNLNLLGDREPDIYGNETLEEIISGLRLKGEESGINIEAFQSNEEGVLVSRIGEASGRFDGIIINPAAYTHTSVALCDAIRASDLPCVEVHLSNIYARESFRQTSITSVACIGQISGFGAMSYFLALDAVTSYLRKAGV